jgi:hypothetical protein
MAAKKVAPEKKAKSASKKADSTNRVNSFAQPKLQDHTILDADGKVVGHVRVKPSGVLWAPRDSKVWYGLSLEQFASHAVSAGKKKKK